MNTQIENPKGLHQRYYVQKLKVIPNPYFGVKSNSLYSKRRNTTSEFKIVKVPVGKNDEYFLLKLNK